MFIPPDHNIDKCTIIRAVYYDEYGVKSTIKTGTYFVGFDDKEAYNDIHILSIITDPDNLFDYDTGIYVLGSSFDSNIDKNLSNPRRYFWEANYRNRGPEWERPATIQLFNPDKEIVLTQDIGVRIQGGASRSYYPKSLNFYARESYDGNTQIHYDFWENGYIPEKMTMTVGGNDYKAKLKDWLFAELISDYPLETMHFTPCLTFLDGEFWGVYYLTEKYDNVYIENTYQVSRDNIIMVKHGNLDHGAESDMQAYKEMVDFLSNNDLSLNENYQIACNYLDMDHTLNYLAAMIYIARSGDWFFAGDNSQMWRSRSIGNSPYADCKWRSLIFDLNSDCMTEPLASHDTIQSARADSAIVDHLCENREFRESLARRIIDLGQNNFQGYVVNRKLEAYQADRANVNQLNKKRFSIAGTPLQDQVYFVRRFFEKRYDHMIDILKTNFPDLDIDAMHEEASRQRRY